METSTKNEKFKMENGKLNLFEIDKLPPIDNEFFETILKHKNVTIKKIVSNTLKTSQTFNQKEDEFVILLKGCAKIEINAKKRRLSFYLR